MNDNISANNFNKNIYLDNAATSFPKPAEVSDAVYEYLTKNCTSINRGCYSRAYKTEELVYDTREALCGLFNGPSSRNVVFTYNVTTALNILIKGFLKSGDHVLVSGMEHNAVMRPLTQLVQPGISFDRIPHEKDGTLCFSKLKALLRPNTRLVIMSHASNVCGTILPIKEVGLFCKEHNLTFFVDCAQTAGVLPIDMEDMNIDALAFTGHKGLYAPQGVGGFIIRDELISKIEPLISGGTGSVSHTEDIPAFMPDRFEPGTPNLPGIAGLAAALKWLEKIGRANILSHELDLTNQFLTNLLPLEDRGLIKIIGKKDVIERVGVVSIQTATMDMAKAAALLDTKYGIAVRVGLHCAPNAHKVLATFPKGTLRFSFGYFNTKEDVDAALLAINEICKM